MIELIIRDLLVHHIYCMMYGNITMEFWVQFEWFYNITQQSRQTSAAVSNAGLEVNLWTSEKNRVWWRRQRGRNAFFCMRTHRPQENLWLVECMMICIRLLVMHCTDESSDNKLTYFKQKKNYLYQQNMNM